MAAPEDHLPLKPQVFEILLCLLEGDSHGYAIMQAVADRTEGRVTILAGALYRHLHAMLESGLIEELQRAPVDGSPGKRRRRYRLTRLGREVARAEASRLLSQVRAARERALLMDGGAE